MEANEIKDRIKGLDYNEAVGVLDSIIAAEPDCEDAYVIRGMKHWGAGRRSLAINDYLSAIRINPDSRAREALRAANEILDYRNKDLYNP